MNDAARLANLSGAAMADFSRNEDVRRWLDDIEPESRRREVAVALAARMALRAMPLVVRSTLAIDSLMTRMMPLLLRAVGLAWVCAKYPTFGASAVHLEFAENAVSALEAYAYRIAGQLAQTVANAALHAVKATIPEHAERPTKDALTCMEYLQSSVTLASTRAGDVAAVRPRGSVADPFGALSDDALRIDAGHTAQALTGAPLWLIAAPPLFNEAWRELKSAMLKSHPDWRVWTDWYDSRLAGDAANEAVEVARALIDDEMWRDGARTVNAEIARLIAEHEALKPAPAAFRFQVVNDRIDAAPLDARPLDADAAQDFYDETKFKAIRLQDVLTRAQADKNLRAHVDRLIKRLGGSYEDMRPGLMISLLRSLESDVRAYDSDEGRKELSAAHLSQILDMTATLRDLCATFPILREIEAEAVSYDLAPEKLDGVRERIDSVVEIVNHSDGVTNNSRAAINTSAENIDHQRHLSDEAKQSAYFLVDFAEFTRSGLRHLKKVGGELGGLGADSWKAFRRGAPKGVERGAAQLGRAVIVGGVGGLMHALGSDIAAIAGMVAAYDPLNTVLQHMTNSPPTPHVPDQAPVEAPAASSDADETKIAPRPRAPKKRAPPKRGKV